MSEGETTTGLSAPTASMLSYLGWWVTGAIIWGLERRSPLVRFHAIQSTIAFGGLALLIGLLGGSALLLLTFAPGGFTMVIGAAFGVWVASMFLWLLALWKASRGEWWRIPLAWRVAAAWTEEAIDEKETRKELSHGSRTAPTDTLAEKSP